ncbi:MAG: hypothetical protein CSA66_02810 [Proteobacteria bacterium]|nr:MAG: hypothetical protein CSA66_02810 [Pseudomonadota bacterium]
MARRALPATRALLERVRGALSRADGGDGEVVRAAALRVVGRAERLFDRLDRTARTMERVAEVELGLVERLVPIVEDLGELVRLSVIDARRRLGLPADTPANTDAAAADADVIDTVARPLE